MRLETVPVVSEPLPDTFSEIPNYTIKFMSENRHNNDLRIYEGINVELLYGSGMQPFTHHSYDDYLAKMSSPYTYMGQPESQLYRPSTAKRYTFTSTKPPYLLLLLPQRMTFTYATL